MSTLIVNTVFTQHFCSLLSVPSCASSACCQPQLLGLSPSPASGQSDPCHTVVLAPPVHRRMRCWFSADKQTNSLGIRLIICRLLSIFISWPTAISDSRVWLFCFGLFPAEGKFLRDLYRMDSLISDYIIASGFQGISYPTPNFYKTCSSLMILLFSHFCHISLKSDHEFESH